MVRIATLILALLVPSQGAAAQCFQRVDRADRLTGRVVDAEELFNNLHEVVRDIGKYETTDAYAQYLSRLHIMHPWMKDTLIVFGRAPYESYDPDRSLLTLGRPILKVATSWGFAYPGKSRQIPGYSVSISDWYQAAIYSTGRNENLGTYKASNAMGATVVVSKERTIVYGLLPLGLDRDDCALFQPVLRLDPEDAQRYEEELLFACEFVLAHPYWAIAYDRIEPKIDRPTDAEFIRYLVVGRLLRLHVVAPNGRVLATYVPKR